MEHTSLANEKKEPDATGEVEHQRHGIARVAQQIDNAKKRAVEGAPEPARLDGRAVEDGGVGRVRLVGAGGAADEGRGEAPGEADEDEAEDVVNGWGAGLCVCHCCCVTCAMMCVCVCVFGGESLKLHSLVAFAV